MANTDRHKRAIKAELMAFAALVTAIFDFFTLYGYKEIDITKLASP
jgi:hypothetical protein